MTPRGATEKAPSSPHGSADCLSIGAEALNFNRMPVSSGWMGQSEDPGHVRYRPLDTKPSSTTPSRRTLKSRTETKLQSGRTAMSPTTMSKRTVSPAARNVSRTAYRGFSHATPVPVTSTPVSPRAASYKPVGTRSRLISTGIISPRAGYKAESGPVRSTSMPRPEDMRSISTPRPEVLARPRPESRAEDRTWTSKVRSSSTSASALGRRRAQSTTANSRLALDSTYQRGKTNGRDTDTSELRSIASPFEAKRGTSELRSISEGRYIQDSPNKSISAGSPVLRKLSGIRAHTRHSMGAPLSPRDALVRAPPAKPMTPPSPAVSTPRTEGPETPSRAHQMSPQAALFGSRKSPDLSPGYRSMSTVAGGRVPLSSTVRAPGQQIHKRGQSMTAAAATNRSPSGYRRPLRAPVGSADHETEPEQDTRKTPRRGLTNLYSHVQSSGYGSSAWTPSSAKQRSQSSGHGMSRVRSTDTDTSSRPSNRRSRAENALNYRRHSPATAQSPKRSPERAPKKKEPFNESQDSDPGSLNVSLAHLSSLSVGYSPATKPTTPCLSIPKQTPQAASPPQPVTDRPASSLKQPKPASPTPKPIIPSLNFIAASPWATPESAKADKGHGSHTENDTVDFLGKNMSHTQQRTVSPGADPRYIEEDSPELEDIIGEVPEPEPATMHADSQLSEANGTQSYLAVEKENGAGNHQITKPMQHSSTPPSAITTPSKDMPAYNHNGAAEAEVQMNYVTNQSPVKPAANVQVPVSPITSPSKKVEPRRGDPNSLEPGQVFQNRYQVVKKLGSGDWSTVWLAFDTTRKKFTALKVSKETRSKALHEIEIYEMVNSRVEEADRDDPHSSHQNVILMLDHFEARVGMGINTVMAFEVLGKDLLSLITHPNGALTYQGIPISQVKKIAKHALHGLCYLHDTVRVFHCDLKPENILLSSTRPDQYKCIEQMAFPYIAAHYENAASLTREQMLEFIASTPVFPDQVKIIDLGASRTIGDTMYSVDMIQTLEYRSPEVVLGFQKVGPPVDVWSLACIIWEMLTGVYLFNPGDDIQGNPVHVALFMARLGELPKSMSMGDGKYVPIFYDSNGRFKHQRYHPIAFSDLTAKHGYSYEEGAEIVDFLLPMLRYNPDDRVTARHHLNHPWLKDV